MVTTRHGEWRPDLCKIFYFADVKGKIESKPQRKVFSIIDGVVGGENDKFFCFQMQGIAELYFQA